jgi:diacylglycerol kinase (ATP)
MESGRWKRKPYDPLRKVETILRGLKVAVIGDFSVAYKLVLSAVILALTFHLRHWIDGAVVILATAAVVSAELFNTAMEALCDYVEPGHDLEIGAVKDIAAAAAGIAVFVWAGILIYEYASALLELSGYRGGFLVRLGP